eukprot:SAG11_NODE_10155_length_851_cov_0.888298_2_plen_65_part_01
MHTTLHQEYHQLLQQYQAQLRSIGAAGDGGDGGVAAAVSSSPVPSGLARKLSQSRAGGTVMPAAW